jgi:hypothetical protein
VLAASQAPYGVADEDGDDGYPAVAEALARFANLTGANANSSAAANAGD